MSKNLLNSLVNTNVKVNNVEVKKEEVEKEEVKVVKDENYQMKINDLAAKFNVAHNVIRTKLAQPIPGEIYNPEILNQMEVKNYLVKRFGKDECDKILGFDITKLEIIKMSHAGANVRYDYLVNVNQLVEGKKYVIRNYHYTTDVTFIGSFEKGKKTYYIFQTLNEGYKTYDNLDLKNIGEKNHNLKIKFAEEEESK